MRRFMRTGAYVASVALAASGLTLVATPAQADPDPVPAGNAADWLVGELTDDIVHNDDFDFDDIALTADFAFALNALERDEASDILDAIEPRAEGEWYTSEFGGVTTTYGGSIAKLLALVQQLEGDPSSFGGEDLVARLEAQVATAAPIAGRVQNTNDSFGDANTIGQAYAALGLEGGESPLAADATAFLLKQQCTSGYFRLGFTGNKAAANQNCVDGTSAPDTDATAIALLQLTSLESTDEVDDAIERATDWLISQQRCDGSFGGGTSTEGSNANSTGLVAWALAGEPTALQAANWLLARQVPQDETGPLAGEQGAIAYDPAALATGRTAGITDEKADEWRRATSQAAVGLASRDDEPAPAITLAGPTGYVRGGGPLTLTTSGANEGTVLCLTGRNASTKGISDGEAWSSTVTAPAATATRTYVVTDSYGNRATASVKVLGAKTLVVRKSKARVKRGRSVTAAITGLAAGEAATIRYKGKVVKAGKAGPGGRFAATFKVGQARGAKRIVGRGQFGTTRAGSTTIRVVR